MASPFPPYPDTAAGALALLRENTDFTPAALATASTEPHPPGCWLVVVPTGPHAGRFLVYVGTHPLASDFERIE